MGIADFLSFAYNLLHEQAADMSAAKGRTDIEALYLTVFIINSL